MDPPQRAELREWARDIIRRDRAANKAGVSQNTIGAIERALVRAFQLGRATVDAPPPPPRLAEAGLDWEEVNPRGREVLMLLTFRCDGFEVPPPAGLQALTVDGRTRWAHLSADGRRSDHRVASGSVDPLVRKGLLEPQGDDRLVLTAKGRATCEAYWRRRAADDPSLPLEGMRP